MIIKLHLVNLELLKRVLYKKNELKNKIIITLKKNQNQKKNRNIFFQTKQKNNKKSYITKHNNRCIFSGRTKFYIKFYRSSRHYANKLAFFGKLQNAALKSW